MAEPKAAPRRRKTTVAAEVALQMPDAIRDRVKEFRRVPSDELQDNERNWRTHPYAQRQALAELLEKVGIAGAQADWPTLILDVSDEEADLLLLTLDPIAGLADSDGAALRSLLDSSGTGTPGLEDLMRQLAQQVEDAPMEELEKEAADTSGPPEMELQAFEHYDYVLVLFRSSHDWMQAVERLGLQQEAFTLRDGETRKIGRGRVVDGSKLLELLGRQ